MKKEKKARAESNLNDPIREPSDTNLNESIDEPVEIQSVIELVESKSTRFGIY